MVDKGFWKEKLLTKNADVVKIRTRRNVLLANMMGVFEGNGK